jgi:hypothetical protein
MGEMYFSVNQPLDSFCPNLTPRLHVMNESTFFTKTAKKVVKLRVSGVT